MRGFEASFVLFLAGRWGCWCGIDKSVKATVSYHGRSLAGRWGYWYGIDKSVKATVSKDNTGLAGSWVCSYDAAAACCLSHAGVALTDFVFR